MKKVPSEDADPVHAWLVLGKAFHAMTKFAMAGIEESGLGDSDFRVLEVLLHKGPLPVNVIGPKVFLTPARRTRKIAESVWSPSRRAERPSSGRSIESMSKTSARSLPISLLRSSGNWNG
jgi:hypothetical protein